MNKIARAIVESIRSGRPQLLSKTESPYTDILDYTENGFTYSVYEGLILFEYSYKSRCARIHLARGNKKIVKRVKMLLEIFFCDVAFEGMFYRICDRNLLTCKSLIFKNISLDEVSDVPVFMDARHVY